MLTGISGIEPPLRLMLLPYASAYAQHFPQDDPNESDWTTTFNGGMDVKLGLTDAYTLDMTSIPDFGQVVSDNVVLNLSPFEVQFNENRQFFTEGTEPSSGAMSSTAAGSVGCRCCAATSTHRCEKARPSPTTPA
ncbi:MAG: hypothetical protein IPM46_09710 [Flavobacteriales bacterium]|nr:hypothetical protein [Flavobacteriales bacterium]